MKAVCRGQYQRYQRGGGQTENIQSQNNDPAASAPRLIRLSQDRLGSEGTSVGFKTGTPGPNGTGPRPYLMTEIVVVRLIATGIGSGDIGVRTRLFPSDFDSLPRNRPSDPTKYDAIAVS